MQRTWKWGRHCWVRTNVGRTEKVPHLATTRSQTMATGLITIQCISTCQFHPCTYDLPFNMTTYRQKAFFPHTIAKWNALTANIDMALTDPGLIRCQGRILSKSSFFRKQQQQKTPFLASHLPSPPSQVYHKSSNWLVMKLTASTRGEEVGPAAVNRHVLCC